MSANSRLARLKRSPLVKDVPTLSSQRQVAQSQRVQNAARMAQQQQQQQGSQGQQNGSVVQPMTILTWHEQRLNKMDEVLQNYDESRVDPAVIVPMVESIEALDKRVKMLQGQVEYLLSKLNNVETEPESVTAPVEVKPQQKKGKKSKKDLKKSVEESLESVKLTVKEKKGKN